MNPTRSTWTCQTGWPEDWVKLGVSKDGKTCGTTKYGAQISDRLA